MRSCTPALAALLLFSASAFADDLTLTLDTPVTYPSGSSTVACELAGDAGPCIIFTGTIVDNDTDGSVVSLNDILITFGDPAVAGFFSQDNTFTSNVPGVLIGDGVTSDDTYTGPIFGLGFAADALPGDYAFTATVEATDQGGNDFDSSIASSAVVITPEPITGALLLLAMPVVAALRHRRSQV